MVKTNMVANEQMAESEEVTVGPELPTSLAACVWQLQMTSAGWTGGHCDPHWSGVGRVERGLSVSIMKRVS